MSFFSLFCVSPRSLTVLSLPHELILSIVNLPAHFLVWLTCSEAEFLKGKLVWVNWDVDELKDRADEIKNSLLLTVGLHGVPL